MHPNMTTFFFRILDFMILYSALSSPRIRGATLRLPPIMGVVGCMLSVVCYDRLPSCHPHFKIYSYKSLNGAEGLDTFLINQYIKVQ